MKMRLSLTCAVVMGLTASVSAQFTPGNVFVAEGASFACKHLEKEPGDRIIEIDPATGETSVFVEIPDDMCGVITGLVFTPDGSRLRASSWLQSWILEIDPNGNIVVILDYPSDGIGGPFGWNNLAYDAAGNFYVGNDGTRNILKFSVEGGSATIIADVDDGVGRFDALTISDSGDVYWSTGFESLRQVRVLLSDGTVSTFDTFGSSGGALPLTSDENGSLFVQDRGNVYKYEAGEPESRELLTTLTQFGAMAMSPDQSKIYYHSRARLSSIDVVDGVVEVLAEFLDGVNGGLGGIAVVPTVPSDLDRDADVDIDDHSVLTECLAGPGIEIDPANCPRADIDQSGAVDLGDVAVLQTAFTGP